MSTSIAGSKQKKEDLEVVIKYVKNDLFAKVKFIYNPKVDLAVGGKIYTDYKRKCKNRIGGRGLTAKSHGGGLDRGNDKAHTEESFDPEEECSVHRNAE